jgi:hypothetical protein
VHGSQKRHIQLFERTTRFTLVTRRVKGEHDALADALSCSPFSERQKQESHIKNPNDQRKNHDSSPNDSLFHLMAIDDGDLSDCFVCLPDQAGAPFVLDLERQAAAIGTTGA